jgi:hypothetical protein
MRRSQAGNDWRSVNARALSVTTDDPQTAADHTASAAERQRSGSGGAAERHGTAKRQPSGSGAGLQQIALHQTDCRFRSLSGHESEVIHDPAG